MQLLGAVQLDNAETAVAAALQLRKDGFPNVTDEDIAAGLAEATLLGRFQVSSPTPEPVSSRQCSYLCLSILLSWRTPRRIWKLHLHYHSGK